MSPVMFAADDELAVLGWFIAEPSCRRKLLGEIKSVDAFEGSGMGAFWSMLTTLHAQGGDLDPAIARREAKKRGIAVADEQHALMALRSPDLAGSVRSVRMAAMRRWMVRQGERLQKSAEDPTLDPVALAGSVHEELGKAVRVASKISDRSGGYNELAARLDGMATGRIANMNWPDAPIISTLARALESASITMMSGSPGDGKTWWLLQSAIGWREAGIRVSICMLEKTRDWHLNRVLAILAAEPGLTRSEWVAKNAAAAKRLHERWSTAIETIGQSIVTARSVGESLADVGRWIDSEADEHDIVVVDPISLADAGDQRWLADRSFISGCIRTCERTGVRIVLVSHPNATKNGPVSLSSLMGGVSYQRATDSVLHVTKLEHPKKFGVWRPPSTLADAYAPGAASSQTSVVANRTVSVFKGRNGTAGGKRFAFDFDDRTLRFVEQGLIVSDEKRGADE